MERPPTGRLAWVKRMMRGARGEKGSALVEFAVVVVVLVTFMMGIMDFSRFLYTYHHISNAAREGARWAAVRGSSWSATCSTPLAVSFDCRATTADVQSYVASITPPGISTDSTVLQVLPTWPGTDPTGVSCGSTLNSPGCVVNVQLTYAFKFMFAVLPLPTFNITSTSQMVILQ